MDVVLQPAAPGTGILFVRREGTREVRFPARPEWVVDTKLATTLGANEERLSTVEHCLSALLGMGVDNCTVEVSGPELPIMDGSAAPFVYLIRQAGLRAQRRLRRALVVRRPIEVRDGNRSIRVVPSRDFRVSVEVDYDHPVIGKQELRALRMTPTFYAREIAPARTFGFLRDVQQMQAAGLALGGSLQNAVVMDEQRVLNRDGLRFPDEFARHKVLDLVGDLALLGLSIRGHVQAVRPGHALHQALVAEIRANPACWSVEVPSESLDAIPQRVPELQPLRQTTR